MKNVLLRVKMTADGWFGELVSAPVKVSKAANNADPGIPTLTAEKDASGNYTTFTITGFDSKKEYVYTTSAVNGWPSAVNGWSTSSDRVTYMVSPTVYQLDSGTTYYVYTRYKATDTTEAGTVVRRSSVLLNDITKLNRLVLSDSAGNTYTDYGTGNTIYVEKNKTVTLTVSKDPTNATQWSAYTFGPDSGSTTTYTVTTPANGSVAANTNIENITITGKESGSDWLVAKYSGYTPQYYGRWKVVVYDDVSKIDFANITINNKPAFPNVTMYKGETAAVPTYAKLTTSPADALNGYTLAWRVMKPAVGYGQPTYETSNGYLEVSDDGIKALKNTAEADSKYQTVALCAMKGSSVYEIASYLVTVTDAPKITPTSLTMSLTKSLLKSNDAKKLTAAMTPVNADGTLSWNSSNPDIAKVDNEGNVTAVSKGEATITVSCNGTITATCTVLVDHTHSYGAWTSGGDAGHYRTCSCDAVETAPHTWVYDAAKSTPATETSTGAKFFACVCGETKTETIAKLTSSGSSLNYFADVPTSSYYYDAVLWAVEQGITQGTDNSHFSPSGICTRAQAVTFLWRAAGSPAPKATTMPFTDVKSGVYYYDAVLWAVENGITKGTGDTTFSPNQTCSRAQIVTFLWRTENSPAAGTVNPFTDVKSDAYYADAVLWAVKEDVTKGTTNTTFSPSDDCTRAQIVTFIYRCMK